jgi:hypothetical protein
MDVGSFTLVLQTLSSSVKLYKDANGLVKDIQNYFDKGKSAESKWCVYFNPLERFKISWPSQRWAFREIGPVLPSLTYLNTPMQLRFRLNPEPTQIPNLLEPSIALFHNFNVTVDLHGEIGMSTYVKTANENISRLFEAVGAKYYDEKSGQRIEDDNARIACRIVFPQLPKTTSHNTSDKSLSSDNGTQGMERCLLKFTRIIRFGERMYNLTGTIVESAGMDEIALKDLVGIAD